MFAYYRVPPPANQPPEPENTRPGLPSDHETRAVLEQRIARWPRKRRRALEFQRWRYEQGRIPDDDVAVSLTDEEIDFLARHVLP